MYLIFYITFNPEYFLSFLQILVYLQRWWSFEFAILDLAFFSSWRAVTQPSSYYCLHVLDCAVIENLMQASSQDSDISRHIQEIFFNNDYKCLIVPPLITKHWSATDHYWLVNHPFYNSFNETLTIKLIVECITFIYFTPL